MNKYLLFVRDNHCYYMGVGDFINQFKTFSEAKERIFFQFTDSWCRIFRKEDMVCVWCDREDIGCKHYD